ncbi:unnamed protein product [Aphanomyces euteiches]
MDVLRRKAANESIQSGIEANKGTQTPIPYVDDDLVVNNPKAYPKQGCQLPDYQSKKGRLFSVAKNGTEVPFQIKGVNWFGMETGTTIYAIAVFLNTNKFNSIRLPLCVQNVLNNDPLKASVINKASNRALDLSSYISLIQSLTKALGYRQISVMFSMHCKR